MYSYSNAVNRHVGHSYNYQPVHHSYGGYFPPTTYNYQHPYFKYHGHNRQHLTPQHYPQAHVTRNSSSPQEKVIKTEAHKGHIGSPGSKLFFYLKSYANHLYSMLLLKSDIECLSATPRKMREYQRIFNTLSFVQLQTKSSDSIKHHELRVHEAVVNLIKENINLMLTSYSANLKEILHECKKLLNHRLKYVPHLSTIIKYVKPNMSRRRLFAQIFPKLQDAMDKILKNLDEEHKQISTSTSSQFNKDQPTAPQINTIPSEMIGVDTPMDKSMEENWTTIPTLRGNGKKRNFRRQSENLPDSDSEISKARRRIDTNEFSFSSLDPSFTDVDIDSNNLGTVDDCFHEYKTFMPSNQVLPPISKPPSKSKKLRIPSPSKNFKNYQDAISEFVSECAETGILSNDESCIVSISTKDLITSPVTHLTITTSDNTFCPEELDNLPNNKNFIYEIIFTRNKQNDVTLQLPLFLEWVKKRKSPYLVTLDQQLISNCVSLLSTNSLIEFHRPFQEDPCISMGT
jgi:hypothetical protein